MDFYNVSIPPPPSEVFDNTNVIHIARIETWTSDMMDVHWRPVSNQIIIRIEDDWFVQPDSSSIVRTLAELFACEEYQIRLSQLAINDSNAEGEALWTLYNSDWRYYANNHYTLYFSADVDFETDTAPQWVDIVPESQPLEHLAYYYN